MKIKRSKFEYILEKHTLKNRLFKVKNNKYIYLYSFKTIMLSIYRFIEIIALLPINIILAILNTVWDCIIDFPKYIKEFWTRFKDLCPIKYIEVIDDYIEESIK